MTSYGVAYNITNWLVTFVTEKPQWKKIAHVKSCCERCSCPRAARARSRSELTHSSAVPRLFICVSAHHAARRLLRTALDPNPLSVDLRLWQNMSGVFKMSAAACWHLLTSAEQTPARPENKPSGAHSAQLSSSRLVICLWCDLGICLNKFGDVLKNILACKAFWDKESTGWKMVKIGERRSAKCQRAVLSLSNVTIKLM